MAEPLSQTLYNTLTKDGYDLGDYNSFSEKVSNPAKAKVLYDSITKDGYDVGDFNTFHSKVATPMARPSETAEVNPFFTPEIEQGAKQPASIAVTPTTNIPRQGQLDSTSSNAPVTEIPASELPGDEANTNRIKIPDLNYGVTPLQNDAIQTSDNYPSIKLDNAKQNIIQNSPAVTVDKPHVTKEKKFDERVFDSAVSSVNALGGAVEGAVGDYFKKMNGIWGAKWMDDLGGWFTKQSDAVQETTEKNAPIKSGLPEMVGSLLPIAAATVADVYSGGLLTPAIMSTFGASGYGDGIRAYDDIKKQTGGESNEYARTGAGLAYSVIMLGTMNALGKFGVKGVQQLSKSPIITRAIESVFKSNPTAFEGGASELMQAYAKAQPTFAKQLLTNGIHSVATMEGMELSKMGVNAAIGQHQTLQDWTNTATSAAVTGVLFTMVAPFSIKYADAANVSRRNAQGEVTIGMKGDIPVEIIDTKEGNKGLTPDNKLVDIDQNTIQNSFTMTTKHFNQVLDNLKQTKTIEPNLERNAFGNRVAQTLTKLQSSPGVITTAVDAQGNKAYVSGKDKDGNLVGFDANGQIQVIDPNAKLESAPIGSVHDAIMGKWDEVNGNAAPKPDLTPRIEQVKADIQQQQQAATQQITDIANRDTGAVQTVKLADGREVNLTGGNIALTEEGKIDFSNTDKVLYYLDENGTKQMISSDQVNSLVSHTPVDQAIAQSHEQIANATLGKANYQRGMAVVLLNPDGSPQLGDTGKPVSTKLTNVTDNGVEFTTADGQPMQLTFDEAYKMLGHATDHMDYKPGQAFDVDGVTHVIQHPNADGTYKVTAFPQGAEPYDVDVPAEEIDKFVQPLTNSVKTDVVNSQPQKQFPLDKDGQIDFNAITDPTNLADAYTQEFGDQSKGIIEKSIEYVQGLVAKAQAIEEPVKQLRELKKAQGKLDLLNAAKGLLGSDTMPTEVWAAEENTPVETPIQNNSLSLPDRFDNATTLEEKHAAAAEIADKLEGLFPVAKTAALCSTRQDFKNVLAENKSSKLSKAIDKGLVQGCFWKNKVFLNLQDISNTAELVVTWAHEQAHAIVDRTFTKQELEDLYASTDKAVIIDLLPDADLTNSPDVQANEAIAYAIERIFGTSEPEALATGSVQVPEAIAGQKDLSEKVIKVLQILTNNTNHGTNISDGSGQALHDANNPETERPVDGTAEQGASTNIGGQADGLDPASSGRVPGTGGIKPAHAIGEEVVYQGGNYKVNAVGHDVSTGEVIYDLDTLDGKVAHEDVPQGELNKDEAVTVTPVTEPSLTQQRDELQAKSDALRAQASTADKAESAKLYGQAGALNKRIKALNEQIAAEESAKIATSIAEQEPNLSPTEAQQLAGNYKKAHITVQGMDVTVENPKGSTRSGVDEDGKEWEHVMNSHYGYFKRTEGKDGDHIDVFVGDNPISEKIFVVDQTKKGTGVFPAFDESKVMLGYNSPEEAKAAYMENYDKDWDGFYAITEVGVEDFKKWLYDGAKQHKPFHEYKETPAPVEKVDPQKQTELDFVKGAPLDSFTVRHSANNLDQTFILTDKKVQRDRETGISNPFQIYTFSKYDSGETFLNRYNSFETLEDAKRMMEWYKKEGTVDSGLQPIRRYEGKNSDGVAESTVKIAVKKGELDKAYDWTWKPYPSTRAGKGYAIGRLIEEAVELWKTPYEKASDKDGHEEAIREALKAGRLDVETYNRLHGIDYGMYGGQGFVRNFSEALKPAIDYTSARNNFIKKSVSPATKKILDTLEKQLDGTLKTKARSIEELANRGIFANEKTELVAKRAKSSDENAIWSSTGYYINSEETKFTLNGYYVSKTEYEYSKYLKSIVKQETEKLAVVYTDGRTPEGKKALIDAIKAKFEANKKDEPRFRQQIKEVERFNKITAPNGTILQDNEHANEHSRRKSQGRVSSDQTEGQSAEEWEKENWERFAETAKGYVNQVSKGYLSPEDLYDLFSIFKSLRKYAYDTADFSVEDMDDIAAVLSHEGYINWDDEGTRDYFENIYQGLKEQGRNTPRFHQKSELDKNILVDGYQLSAYILDEGNVAFPDYANQMVDAIGQDIIPYLKTMYVGSMWFPGMEKFRSQMSSVDEVDTFDLTKNLTQIQNNVTDNSVSLGTKTNDHESNTEQLGGNSPLENGGELAGSAPSNGAERTTTPPKTDRRNSTGSDKLAGDSSSERRGQGGSEGNSGGYAEPITEGGVSSGETDKQQQDGGNLPQSETVGQTRNTRNYVIPRGTDVAPRGDVAKITANIAAIKLAKKLNESGAIATPEQKDVLAKYTGWGGLAAVFKPDNARYQTLKDALTTDQYDSARASTTTAFFTPPAEISATWDMIQKLGFNGGEILEPSGGIGHFFGLMPRSISENSNLRGVELDTVSGLIFKALYPDAKINISGFEEQRIANNSLDLVVSNVPFGAFKVHDKVDKDLSNKFDIHDFFIAKSVRKLKPGGLGVFITTSSTLDKSTALRNWIINEGNADFIDSVRLNSDTFKQAAGTEATADIIIIRKRDANGKSEFAKNLQDVVAQRETPYTQDKKTSWGSIYGTEEKTATMRINKYFADNPEKMAGEMKFGFEGGNDIRPTEQRLAPVKGISQEQVLSNFVGSLPTNIFGAEPISTERKSVESDGTKEGGLTVIDGVPHMIEYGRAVPMDWNDNKVSGRTKSQVVEDYNAIKTAVTTLLEAENNDSPNIETLRKNLNKVYDSFVKQYGYLSKNAKIPFLRDDVDFPAISAIENVNDVTRPLANKKEFDITKSDVFSKRVIDKQQTLKADNVTDAVKVSMYQSGRVDIPYIATLTGVSEEKAKAEILDKRIGFVNPSTGLVDERSNYLSGNVRQKLAIAEQANEAGEYNTNIEELSKVIPSDIPMHLIKVSLGSTWIPTKAYDKFFEETFGVTSNIQKTSGDKFMGNFQSQRNMKDAQAGVMGATGSQIALNGMNNTGTTIYRWEYVDGQRKSVKDVVATAQAAAKQAELNEQFDAWAKSGANPYAEEMANYYNTTFNAVVPKTVDASSFESFPGASRVKIPREHQKEGTLRTLEAATLLAHEVGTGKTITLISSAMEMRRLGIAKKPCIVVQRSTYDQFVKEIKELYPQAKVLVPSAKDLTAAQREQLFAKIAYNDWDIVVLYHGYLDSIPDDPDRVNQYIDEHIQEKIDLMNEVRASSDPNAKRMASGIEKEIKGLEERKTPSVKQEEKTKAKASAKAEKLLDRRTDNGMTFEQLGIDALLVDEAHAYKKLGFSTSLKGVKGIDVGASQRAQSLRLKSSYILENNNGKNVVFATGTPISNTMAEMWTFLRYLLPKSELDRLQMTNFDSFVNNFGTIEESSEFSTSGKFKVTNRFSSFSNVPELIQAWKQIAHTVLTEEVATLKEGVGTPRVESGKPIDNMLKQTLPLKMVMKSIKQRLQDFENMTGKEKKENSHIPLVMFGLAKRAAIDVRLVDPNLPDDPNSKLNETVKAVLSDLKDTKDYKGTVAVFCDSYQSSDKGFNVFEDIKQKLIDEGIPAEQIAIVNDYTTDEKKSVLWTKVNAGDVRVVMGTTEKLGVGVNIQQRLHTLIHMDAPVRPSDYQQRNGRIMRQGNDHLPMDKTIKILRIGVEQTLDVTGYQRLEIKKKFIDQIMKGDVSHRSLDEAEVEGSDSNNFSQMMASLSGSQAALAYSIEQNKLRKLQNASEYHDKNQIFMSSEVKRNENIIKTTGGIIDGLQKQRAEVKAIFPDGRVLSVTIGNTEVKTTEEIDGLIAKTLTKRIDKEVEDLRVDMERETAEIKTSMLINGKKFNLTVNIKRDYDVVNHKTRVSRQIDYQSADYADLNGSAGAKVENLIGIVNDFISLRGFDEDIRKRGIGVEKAIRENEAYKPQIGQPFPKQKEIEAAEKRAEELDAQMRKELAEIEAKEAAENVQAVDISAGLEEEEPRFRQVTLPVKPKFEGDLKAYSQAMKEYQDKASEVLPELAQELDTAFSNAKDEFLRKRQDADRFIKLQQRFVEEQGGRVTDAEDAYNDKNRSIGRSTYESQEFERNEMGVTRDAYKAIIKSKALDTLADVPLSPDTTQNMRKIGLYLQAKDIQEAIELGLVDRGELGFFEEIGTFHTDYIKEFEAAVSPAFRKDLWAAVNNATRYGLDQELKAGLMTTEDYDKHAARLFYVPQRGWDERDVANIDTHYNKGGGSMYGDPYNAVLIKAKGRQSLGSDPLHFIQSMGHSALLTAEKNLYKQKALNMVRVNIEIGRQSGAFNFKQVWYLNTGTKDTSGAIIYDEIFERPDQKFFEEDKATREEIKGLKSQISEAIKEGDHDKADDIKLLVDEAIDRINIQHDVNDAYKRTRTSGEAIQHEVQVYDRGEKFIIWFKDERVANALNNATDGQVTPYLQNVIGRSTRWYSSIMTQYNPAFAAWNFMRDIELANIALPMEEGLVFTANFNKNVFNPQVSAAIVRHLTGKEKRSIAADKILDNFFADGAATGFTYLKDLDQIKKDLRKAIEPTLLESTLGSQLNLLNAKALGKAFSALTEYSELVTRSAAYKTAIEMGYSREKAATLAKELTVNFNRKGSDTKVFSSMFAFFNASVQGTVRASRLAKYGKTFASIVAGLAVLGFINTLFNPNDPDDEKNWSEFGRMQNVILFGVKLPVTHFFRAFWATGVQAALAYQGQKTISNALFDSFKNFSNEVLPGGINPINAFTFDTESNFVKYDGLRDFVPSTAQPIADVLNNRTFTGATVHREAFTNKDKVPQAFLGKRDVSPAAQAFSDFLLEFGGGDKNIKDTYNARGEKIPFIFDVNPSDAEYLVTGYTGGVGKFVMDIYKATSGLIETGEVDPSKLPVINRAVKPYNEDKVFFGKYYELMNRIKTYENSTSVRKKSFVQEGAVYRPAINDFVGMMSSPQGRLIYRAKGVQAQVEKMQDLIDKSHKSGNQEKAKEYQTKMNGYMKQIDELLDEWKSTKN